MSKVLYNTVIIALTDMLSQRAARSSVRAGLTQLGKTPDDATLADYKQVLRGQVYRQLQLVMPHYAAKQFVRAIERELHEMTGTPLPAGVAEADEDASYHARVAERVRSADEREDEVASRLSAELRHFSVMALEFSDVLGADPRLKERFAELRLRTDAGEVAEDEVRTLRADLEAARTIMIEEQWAQLLTLERRLWGASDEVRAQMRVVRRALTAGMTADAELRRLQQVALEQAAAARDAAEPAPKSETAEATPALPKQPGPEESVNGLEAERLPSLPELSFGNDAEPQAGPETNMNTDEAAEQDFGMERTLELQSGAVHEAAPEEPVNGNNPTEDQENIVPEANDPQHLPETPDFGNEDQQFISDLVAAPLEEPAAVPEAAAYVPAPGVSGEEPEAAEIQAPLVEGAGEELLFLEGAGEELLSLAVPELQSEPKPEIQEQPAEKAAFARLGAHDTATSAYSHFAVQEDAVFEKIPTPQVSAVQSSADLALELARLRRSVTERDLERVRRDPQALRPHVLGAEQALQLADLAVSQLLLQARAEDLKALHLRLEVASELELAREQSQLAANNLEEVRARQQYGAATAAEVEHASLQVERATELVEAFERLPLGSNLNEPEAPRVDLRMENLLRTLERYPRLAHARMQLERAELEARIADNPYVPKVQREAAQANLETARTYAQQVEDAAQLELESQLNSIERIRYNLERLEGAWQEAQRELARQEELLAAGQISPLARDGARLRVRQARAAYLAESHRLSEAVMGLQVVFNVDLSAQPV
ncbi:hypothetical protein HNR42_000301 [Deinobacterium chartae]|uniref:Outer membrane efflux protein n=1 Tax=Deinobacterium chartae TaxID=521158 RepID=A0A841HXB8_9DEIO|nr:hypothetical protein [Deinobacterium chartae]MBB6096889.1 hypothetical protein [Deinobacterium chartae]